MSKMTHLDTHSQRNQLWTIIEKQRVIIQELQKALVDMTSERDSLLLKQKEEPMLPPRSPYREGEKSPFIIQLLHSKWTTLPSGTETPLFILSVLDKKSSKELWRISKLYTDILTLDSALDSVSNKKTAGRYAKLLTDKSYFTSTTTKVELRKLIVEEYLKHVISLPLIDSTPVYTFLRSNIIDTGAKKETKPGHKAGYLTKRGKNFGGWKIRYYVLDGPILKYYETKEGQLLGSICIPEIQIGKQTSKEDQTNPFVNAFILVEPKNKSSGSSYRHILCATSERERDEWVTALQYHTNSAKKTLLYPHQRSSSDTTLDTNDMGQAKIRHRSSMDQSMLHYYNPKKEHSSVLLSKASADSLPIVISHSDDDDTQLKKSKNRRTFWPPRKLFSNQEKQQQKRSGVFGVSLEEVVNTSRISNSCELPAIAYRCIEYLEASNAVKEEGLYRLSGSSVEVDDLRNLFNEMGDVDLLNSGEYHDVHAVAGLLKLWLRELPVNILTPDLATDFLSAVEYADKKQRIQELGRLISMLPLANYTLLRTLIAHLIHVVHNSEHNKMTIRNVGIVFSPTLNIPAVVFGLFLSEFGSIFSSSSSGKSNVTPEASTSADRIKHKYLEAEERLNRNSMKFKNGIPNNLRNLEKYINDKKNSELLLFEDQY